MDRRFVETQVTRPQSFDIQLISMRALLKSRGSNVARVLFVADEADGKPFDREVRNVTKSEEETGRLGPDGRG